MSRSKHTRPLHLRAEDRLRRPYDKRGIDDPASTRRALRRLKERGFTLHPRDRLANADWPLPRIVEKRPRLGQHHPASRSAIAAFLRLCGEEAVYGLRSIELRQGRDSPLFGQYLVPGRIRLYDQPRSPWRFASIHPDELTAMKDSGARIDPINNGALVLWDEESLRRFMLTKVLLHELGHHHLQHHKGQRRARIARTGDHERYAERFTRRARRLPGSRL